jgi:hypothetical protein
MGLYSCRRQHCTSPWRRMWTPLLAGLWLGNPWDRHVMGGRAGSRSAPISRCAALRSWWPRHRATLSLLPTLVPTPPLGYPGDVPDLLLLRFFIFSVSDRVCVSIAHCPLAHASLTLTSTTPATSSPTVLLGAASSVPGDARMPYLHLFVDTSISADSSSPLLIGGGGFCHRHHCHHLRLTHCWSGHPIAHNLTLPRLLSSATSFLTKHEGCSSVASSGSSVAVRRRPSPLHLHRCRVRVHDLRAVQHLRATSTHSLICTAPACCVDTLSHWSASRSSSISLPTSTVVTLN